MIPVAPWHFTTWLDLFDHWQTVIAGVLALAAGVLTVVATMRVIATTVRLEQERVASEARAFRAMLEAAMVRVLAELAWARETYRRGDALDKRRELMAAWASYLTSKPDAKVIGCR